MERLVLEDCDFRLQQFIEVMREDMRHHAWNDSVGAHHQQRGHLCGKHHWLLVAAVV